MTDSDNQLNLSVCIITFNEEANIGDCLESVKWAKEIIVVDSFSTDKTIDICHQYDATVIQTSWEGFGKTKNIALSHATCDWILSLDADERVDASLKEEIASVISNSQLKNGYFIPRKSFFGGEHIKYCGWYPDYVLRLIKRGAGTFKEVQVHEAIVLDLKEAVGYLKNPLLHYTYEGISDFLKRSDRYSTLRAKDKKANMSLFGILLGVTLRPLFAFFKRYILQKGFLGGMTCFVLSVLYAYEVFVKYAKMFELRKEEIKK